LHQDLARQFQPRTVMIEGLAVYHYCGGPWELASRHMFRR